jgi:uncharacterized protein (UPF0212 family)
MTDLVKRLRQVFSRDSLDGVILQMRVYAEERYEAADRIEALEAALRQLAETDLTGVAIAALGGNK